MSTLTRAAKPVSKVFADLPGPKPVKSHGGKWYTKIVRDDYKRFTKLYFLCTKDEAERITTEWRSYSVRSLELVREDERTKYSRRRKGVGI